VDVEKKRVVDITMVPRGLCVPDTAKIHARSTR